MGQDAIKKDDVSGQLRNFISLCVVRTLIREGRPLRYLEFARYGIPVMAVQLVVSAIYLKLRFLR